jgi:hypothetical protein
LLIGALLGSCGGGKTEEQNGQTYARVPDVTVTEVHSRAPLYVGQVLEVRLQGDDAIRPPLRWTLESAPAHLRLLHSDVLDAPGGAAGGGSTWIFQFTAVREGEGRLTFTGGQSGRRVSYEVLTDQNMVVD